jgi:hypothetical protein
MLPPPKTVSLKRFVTVHTGLEVQSSTQPLASGAASLIEKETSALRSLRRGV